MQEPFVIDAKGMHYRILNQIIRDKIKEGYRHFILHNVNGQRYIGAGVMEDVFIEIYGVAGNDLGVFMKRGTIIVYDNSQDGVANTMEGTKIVVHGMAGDVCGYGMRGGKLHVLRDIGYRTGIHMKTYKDMVPVIIVGGKAGDFFGEYMAGGILILLNLWDDDDRPIVGNFLGTGMHGGEIYIRGEVDPYLFGKEVGIAEITEGDRKKLREYLADYCNDFKDYGLDIDEIMAEPFMKLIPVSTRPYGKIYAY
ncbi:glutamate synthase subunit alpha domain-containing protein [Thermosulfidibacter takaii ABI70S6]|uniref:Glutamate synthase subunit alpha domain-containing protein n=1 Tax=Thermosulfidibacter takaii (strain DSM 17441 / JCM 13301 / NBRC 103674 / ABI70S6) TaxID=1298851 RepID=A0A0S3QRB7_THET7|nr:hypothetical protein [Thermosulfidibacter takaii]BAT70825.1 glutamate synthase subunit alpha domain-containing protein [Thermosulfidibacter takaii ABI70S6]